MPTGPIAVAWSNNSALNELVHGGGKTMRLGQVCSSHLPSQSQIRVLIGQQSGNGLNSVTHMLGAAEVAGQGALVLQIGAAVFDEDAPRGMHFALSSCSPRTSPERSS
ncbi:hypothetical protein ABZX69_41510 [Streptomyces sp. NPDC004074]|uniref:hypothetical protein n=1 Tax=Streptomyces sp. NPDC004074 TaxID=3154277 RepID=UPI0033A829D8